MIDVAVVGRTVIALARAQDDAIDLLVGLLEADLREAVGRVRAIRTLDDFDARTAEIAASPNLERSAT